MAFRPNSKKSSKTKMSVRDNRLFMTISAQKKVEDQDALIEELEGVKRKTSSRRTSSTIRKTDGKQCPFAAEDTARDVRVKKKLTKITSKKHRQVVQPSWKSSGLIRGMVSPKAYNKYSPFLATIKSYEGFETPSVQPLRRFSPNSEHRNRYVLCHVCEKIMPSTGEFTIMQDGTCMHRECTNTFIKK